MSNKCERCGQPLNGKESYDLWILVTTYDEDGETVKTNMDVGTEDVKQDYISIGIDCCGERAIKEWNEMVQKLVKEQETYLTTVELFNLGAAYGSFCTGDIDQGIHLVLPVVDTDTGEPENDVFEGLFDLFNKIDPAVEDYSSIGRLYMDAIISWTTANNIDIARQQE